VYRRHRRGMIACGLAALAAGLVFAVLPAGSAGGASGAVGTIAGNVWQDSNENRAKDGFESFQPNWTISLYPAGSTTPLRSTHTTAAGRYEFKSVPLGHPYTVCETKPAGDQNSWGQTTPTTVVCVGLGSNEEQGHQFTLTADARNKNFGNVNTVVLDCNTHSGPVSTQNGDYTVQLAGAGFCTKQGAKEYVFESYTDHNQVASFHPQGAATGRVSVVERLLWDVGNTHSSVLRYDDDVTNGIQLRNMLHCNIDPRVPGSDFELATSVGVLPDTHTSCLITSTEQAGGTRVDFVYSSVDGYRTVG
jgi:hypothetical protein